jgi:hypothetical protein
LPLDTAGFDPGGNINLSTGRYTCPATGYYQVNVAVNCASTAQSQFIVAGVMKNGVASPIALNGGMSLVPAAGALYPQATASGVIQCNAGDYLQPVADTSVALQTWCLNFSVVQVGNSMNFTSASGDLTGTYPNPTVVGHTGVTTSTTAPAAGGAGALPATPTGYMTLRINGVNRQVPYY